MENGIQELIFEILQINACTEDDTKKFTTLSHNEDLVPKYKDNFEKLAQLIGSYYNDCYDIQGVNDNGVDVLLKYMSDDGGHKVGFQIKSYDDMKLKGWLQTLKAQLLEAQGIWKTEDLYVVFCTDAIKHKNKLRMAISDIEKISDCKIHIVEPQKALTFYNFNYVDILLHIYYFFHQNDSHLKSAKTCIENLSNKEMEFLVTVIVRQFINNEKEISLDHLDIPDSIDFLSLLHSTLYNYDEDTNSISYRYENNWDLTYFAVEAKTCFDLEDDELEEFLIKSLIDEQTF